MNSAESIVSSKIILIVKVKSFPMKASKVPAGFSVSCACRCLPNIPSHLTSSPSNGFKPNAQVFIFVLKAKLDRRKCLALVFWFDFSSVWKTPVLKMRSKQWLGQSGQKEKVFRELIEKHKKCPFSLVYICVVILSVHIRIKKYNIVRV